MRDKQRSNKVDISQYKQLVKAKGLNMIFFGDGTDTKAFEIFFKEFKVGMVFFDKITLLFRVQFKEIKPQNIE